jgi:hypothetical protein
VEQAIAHQALHLVTGQEIPHPQDKEAALQLRLDLEQQDKERHKEKEVAVVTPPVPDRVVYLVVTVVNQNIQSRLESEELKAAQKSKLMLMTKGMSPMSELQNLAVTGIWMKQLSEQQGVGSLIRQTVPDKGFQPKLILS